MTIVLTTHYLDEADTMAERVVVVDNGRDHRRRHRRRRSRRSSPATGSWSRVAPAGRAAAAPSLAESLPGARDIASSTG